MESESWNQFLDKTTSSQVQHVLWLKVLSYLEYVGYRKMVKTVGYEGMDPDVFRHLSDEIRHSYMLKELAQKISGEKSNSPETLTSEFVQMAEEYFQSIDQETDHWVLKNVGEKRPLLCYLLVSYLVEKRAMQVYPQYHRRLDDSASKAVIQKIIRDETEHLSYLEESLEKIPNHQAFRQSHLLDFEGRSFERLLKSFGEATL